jgi:hypothetical protein
MSVRMPKNEAKHVIARCCCSNCWNILDGYMIIETGQDGKAHVVDGLVDVKCETRDCQCKGFVSKNYVAEKLADGFRMAMSARTALSEAFPELNPDMKKKILSSESKTEAEFLKELGF